jgi:hypothetical protein
MRFCLFVLMFMVSVRAGAQNDRLHTHGTIGWYSTFATIRLGGPWSIHAEYQWRRDELVLGWQQSLARAGVSYKVNDRVLLRAGYAWIETFAYGTLPINAFGRDFTEHRMYQLLQLNERHGRLEVMHRFMLEQRFVGRYSAPQVTREDEYPLLHRVRYMLRIQRPFRSGPDAPQSAYAAVYNELFIGFGPNVNAIVFDQNRISVLVGYPFSDRVRVEGGYLNQVLQFGRRVEGRPVFQHNNGVIVNAYLTIG